MTEMKKCQYCGALLTEDAEVCGMCGSPTTPPPAPTYTGPEPVVPAEQAIPAEPAQVAEAAEPAFTPPPMEDYKTPEPEVITTPELTKEPSNRGLAVAVEIAAGIFGFLGIGWMLSGKLGLGIGILVGYWIALVLYAILIAVLFPFTGGLSLFGICLLPLVPILSGLILYNQMK